MMKRARKMGKQELIIKHSLYSMIPPNKGRQIDVQRPNRSMSNDPIASKKVKTQTRVHITACGYTTHNIKTPTNQSVREKLNHRINILLNVRLQELLYLYIINKPGTLNYCPML